MVRIRFASILITLFGVVVNFALAVQVISTWRTLKREPESEWETASDRWPWGIDGVKLVWSILSAYFVAAATVCAIGFIGIVKNKPTFIRFYRDYSIADFSFTTFSAILVTYSAFRSASLRASICEELSRQPELMRDLVEMGLNLENCELWFERAVLMSVAVMVVLVVVRLHFLMAVTNYYTHISRHQRPGLPTHVHSRSHSHSRNRSQSKDSRGHSLQRIYLLPTPQSSFHHPHPLSISTTFPPTITIGPNTSSLTPIIYAPVPFSSLPPDVVRSATEAWISRSESFSDSGSPSSSTSSPRSSHKHRQSSLASVTGPPSGSRETVGRISLPIQVDEGLLPEYTPQDATSSPAKKL